MNPGTLGDPFISILVFSMSGTSIIQAMKELQNYKLVCKKWKEAITKSCIGKYLSEKFSLKFPFYEFIKTKWSLDISMKNTTAKAWGNTLYIRMVAF